MGMRWVRLHHLPSGRLPANRPSAESWHSISIERGTFIAREIIPSNLNIVKGFHFWNEQRPFAKRGNWQNQKSKQPEMLKYGKIIAEIS